MKKTLIPLIRGVLEQLKICSNLATDIKPKADVEKLSIERLFKLKVSTDILHRSSREELLEYALYVNEQMEIQRTLYERLLKTQWLERNKI